MDLCILCLEINNDNLACITANSAQWTEQDVGNILEKHFWSLNIQQSSKICLSCWRQLEGFHNFYLRIEEAHLNIGKIKVERLAEALKFKEELIINEASNDFIESIRDDLEFGHLEPESPVDQAQLTVLTKPELTLEGRAAPDSDADRHSTISKAFDVLDEESLRVQSEVPKKCNKNENKRNSKENFTVEESSGENVCDEVKPEPTELKETNVDNDNDVSEAALREETSENKKRNTSGQRRTNPKENDKFIAKHFKQMFCDICHVPFENFPAMQKHFSENHKQRGYVVCCKRKFFQRTKLIDHLHCHLNPDHFKCNECGKAMSDQTSYDTHMLRVHRPNEVIKQHFCDLCDKSFAEAYGLKMHKFTHLSEEEKKFPCADCGKNYGSPYLLNQHRQAVHLRPVNCDVCGLHLTNERCLKLHKETKHPVGGRKEHHCPVCPKISPSLEAHKKHIFWVHKKGYDHKCSICDKGFKTRRSLRNHMASHTGTKLYTCPWCEKTFYSKSNMQIHFRRIHSKEWEESKLQNCSDITKNDK